MSILKKKTTKKDAKEVAVKAATVSNALKNVKSVVLVPRVTEKAALAQSINKYTFVVKNNATKAEVKREIAANYSVTPSNVNFINVEGKRKRTNRGMGRRSDFKKAIVTLPKGQSITIHEGV